jgi:hypothetical protein
VDPAPHPRTMTPNSRQPTKTEPGLTAWVISGFVVPQVGGFSPTKRYLNHTYLRRPRQYNRQPRMVVSCRISVSVLSVTFT